MSNNCKIQAVGRSWERLRLMFSPHIERWTAIFIAEKIKLFSIQTLTSHAFLIAPECEATPLE